MIAIPWAVLTLLAASGLLTGLARVNPELVQRISQALEGWPKVERDIDVSQIEYWQVQDALRQARESPGEAYDKDYAKAIYDMPIAELDMVNAAYGSGDPCRWLREREALLSEQIRAAHAEGKEMASWEGVRNNAWCTPRELDAANELLRVRRLIVDVCERSRLLGGGDPVRRVFGRPLGAAGAELGALAALGGLVAGLTPVGWLVMALGTAGMMFLSSQMPELYQRVQQALSQGQGAAVNLTAEDVSRIQLMIANATDPTGGATAARIYGETSDAEWDVGEDIACRCETPISAWDMAHVYSPHDPCDGLRRAIEAAKKWARDATSGKFPEGPSASGWGEVWRSHVMMLRETLRQYCGGPGGPWAPVDAGVPGRPCDCC